MTQSLGALAGLKVIDLTRVLGGPFGTQALADHGASVIKVEPPHGDDTRQWGPPFRDGMSAYFEGINRNKKFVALDLRREEGRAVLMRLLADADVLIHNSLAGTFERWGIGYDEVLSKRFPRLIYCHITGFGEDGPLGGLPGYDAAVQAIAGDMSVNGTPETGPLRAGVPLVDIGAGLNAALAIAMAIIERSRSGLGQKIDIALYDSAMMFLHPHAPSTLMTGEPPTLTGNAHSTIAPYDKFPTGSGEIFLAVGNNGQFAKLCDILGRPELAADPRFSDNAQRIGHRNALTSELVAALRTHQADALAQRLLAAGVPAGAVLGVPEVLAAPHTMHRDMVVERDGYRALGIPIKFSRTPGSVRSVPGAFGADTREVLGGLGLSGAEIERLIAEGIAFDRPP